ncbi:MAG: regulatory iron-sulfur-containing complex subunit RicT [Patescibacteria group bacterium]|jgi:cell fate regulator YaaT (PSP1 superfamily)
MKVVKIQFASWDKPYYFSPNDLDLIVGNKVIVETELGLELGEVLGFSEIDLDLAAIENEKGGEKKEVKPVLHLATEEDLKKVSNGEEKSFAMQACRKMIENKGLPMKLVDTIFSFSGNRINFAFIADGRVDFRDLVKELTTHFGKMIRLTQIGIRDEARLMGDCGHCGRPLCCRGFIKDFSSVGSEMAETQQVVHRGSDRISGCCGRLMCCLQYENQGYKEMAEKMPAIGVRVSMDGKRGIVVGIHVLKQSLDVEFHDERGGRVVTEVDLNRKKNS